ncbi:MAG: hypothetical protein IPG99_16340 [Ignavibacteria bacterium]|jgi:hypothetical protein|nr:hypothetical protein [Ignavibacteria bacterium]MBK9227370.1 hypothetical protein [Ignavibacteria bacterium]
MLKLARVSVFFLALFALTAISESAFSQKLPGVSVSTNKKSYSPGESGVLIISFKTASGVKIPKEPGVEINVSGIEGQGLQDYSGGEGDYISGSKVKYNFVVPGNASSGSSLTLDGSVRFGYCSTSDGVCKMGDKNFSAKIKVK